MNIVILIAGILMVFYWGQLKLERDKAMHMYRHIPDVGNRELFTETDAKLNRWTIVCFVLFSIAICWFLIKDAYHIL